MGPTNAHGLAREPNVVPMIDILLVLLIAAILWALPGWKTEVQLPVPEEPGTPGAPATPIVLTIAAGPTYSVNGRPIARDRLVEDLRAIYEGRPEKILFIDAAPELRYQDVFWAYGAVRGAGVRVTAIVPPRARDVTSPARP